MPVFDSQGREKVNLNQGITAISAGTTRATSGEIVFSNSNGISWGINGQTVTAQIYSLSTYEPYPIHNTGTTMLSAGTNTSATITLVPFEVRNYVGAFWLNVVQSMNFTTVGTSSGRQTLNVSYGIYTRNVSTLSMLTSHSYSIGVTGNNSSYTLSQPTTTYFDSYGYSTTASAGSNISSQYTGLKLVQFIFNSTLTPGYYWLGLAALNSTSSNNVGILYSYFGNNFSLTGLAPMGSLSTAYTTGTALYPNAIGNWAMGWGIYTDVGLNSMPNAINISAMTANVTCNPYMRFART